MFALNYRKALLQKSARRQDQDMDPFSNSVFPFTVAATLAMITGFFAASRLSLNPDGDLIFLTKLGLRPTPIMVLLTLILGFFAVFGFSIRLFAGNSVTTGTICLFSISISIVLTYWAARTPAKA